MIEPEMEDALDALARFVQTKKRTGTGDLTRRYVHAAQDCERDCARREKREERGLWR